MHASPFRMDIFEERNTALLLHTLYGGGFGAQILAQVAPGKLRIAGQRQVEAFDLVDLQCQVIGGQAQNVAALGLVAAEVVEVPARQVDAVHIPGTPDGDIVRFTDEASVEKRVLELIPECLQRAFDPDTKAGCSLREKFAQSLPLAALIAADFDRVAQNIKWATSTKKEYMCWFELLVSKFGRIPFCEITQEKFALHLREGGYSDYQINGQICAMRALVAYEEAQYLISEHFIDTFTMGNRRTVVGLRDASRHFEKNILTHAQVERIAASCVGMLEDNRGYLYFGLILLMTTGITISELCALTWGSFSFSKTYAGIIVVEIMAETKLVGDVYRIEELNGPRRRTIPLPPAVAKFYHRVRDNAPNIQENAPFMRSFKNAARRIRPDEFDRWLKGFFKSFGFSKQPELKSLTKNPERTLRATFRSALESCGCDADEIRYLYGSAPESVFARNYCAYDDPRELAKLAAVLDKYAISLTETPCDVSEFKISRKDEDVVMTSTPNCRFSGDVIIDIDGISGHNFEAGSDLLLCIKSNDNIFFTAKLKSKET